MQPGPTVPASGAALILPASIMPPALGKLRPNAKRDGPPGTASDLPIMLSGSQQRGPRLPCFPARPPPGPGFPRRACWTVSRCRSPPPLGLLCPPGAGLDLPGAAGAGARQPGPPARINWSAPPRVRSSAAPPPGRPCLAPRRGEVPRRGGEGPPPSGPRDFPPGFRQGFPP